MVGIPSFRTIIVKRQKSINDKSHAASSADWIYKFKNLFNSLLIIPLLGILNFIFLSNRFNIIGNSLNKFMLTIYIYKRVVFYNIVIVQFNNIIITKKK